MIKTKIQTDTIKYGVILKRYYLENANEVGSISEWNKMLTEIYANIPFPSIFKDLRVNAWNMDSELLDEQTKNRIANLQDLRSDEEGYQVCAGLYFNRDRLDIAFFNEGWTPENVDYIRPISDSKRESGLKTFNHEFGHHLIRVSGILNGGSVIRSELNKHYLEQRATINTSIVEGAAEECRAFFGDSKAFGRLSNDAPLKIDDHPKLYTLLRTAYWLQSNLANKNISKTLLWNNEFLWNEVEFKAIDLDGDGWPEIVNSVWYSVDRDWKKYIWFVENGAWKKRPV